MSIWRRITGRSRKAGAERRQAWLERRAAEQRERAARADAWLAAGPPAPERIAAEYEARLALLDDELRPWSRPVAAWRLRDGEPRVESSRMGGRPSLHPDEPWPGDGDPMRFWAQVNLADLAPFAQAYGVALPADGVVQLFGGDEGGELARYVPAGELGGLELRERVPIGPLWDGVDDAEEVHRRTLLISLYPEALVPWQETSPIAFRDDDIDAPLPCTTSEELPGYSFGWWPFSSWGLGDGLYGWPADRPKPPPEDWVFLAVCDSNRDLGLMFSDAGFLWATIPAADLAAGDFSQLRADGESS